MDKNSFKILTKLFLIQNLRAFLTRKNGKVQKSSIFNLILPHILYFVLVLYVLFPIKNIMAYYLMAIVLTIFLNLTQLIETYLVDNDMVEIFKAMPIDLNSVIAAKNTSIFISFLLNNISVFAAFIIGLLYFLKLGIMQILISLLILAVIVIFCIAIVYLLLGIVYNITNLFLDIKKIKKYLTIISATLMMVSIFLVSFKFRSSIADTSLISLNFIHVIMIFVLGIIAMIIGGYLFLRINNKLLSSQIVSVSQKVKVSKFYQQAPLTVKFLINEFKLMMENSTLLIMEIMTIMTAVIIMIVLAFVLKSEITDIASYYLSFKMNPISSLLIFAVTVSIFSYFLPTFSAYSVINLSRHAYSFNFYKTTPINLKIFMLYSLIASSIPTLIIYLGILIFAVIIKISLFHFLLLTLALIIAFIIANFNSILMDLYFPKLNYTDYRQISRRNFTVLFVLLIDILLIIINSICCYIFFSNPSIALIVLIGLNICYAVIFVYLVWTKYQTQVYKHYRN